MAHDTTKKSILLLASNRATSPVTGWPIGFWWSELTHPWLAFHEAGYEITIVSPDGGALSGDTYSDPEDESGYSAGDIISRGFKNSPDHAALLADTPALGTLDLDEFDAIMLAGGQGPMVTFYDDERVHDAFAAFYESGRPACAICHATCILLNTKLTDGTLLVEGRTWTGFADAEERFAEQAAGQKLQPFWIEERAADLANTNFITAVPFSPFAVRDGTDYRPAAEFRHPGSAPGDRGTRHID